MSYILQGKLDSYREKVDGGEELNKDQKVGFRLISCAYILYDFKAQLHGTGSRSQQVYEV